MVPKQLRPIEIDSEVARVPLTQNRVAIIDASDVALVNDRNWFAVWSAHSASFYAGHARTKMHRLILGAKQGQQVDHLNHDTLDNRRANIVLCTSQQNARNRYREPGASGFLGVQLRGKSWRAYVWIDGKQRHVGCYATAIEAAIARDAFIVSNFPGERWTLNFEESR